MNNFLVRASSGLLVAGLFIGAVLYSAYTYGSVILICVLGGLHEFYGITTTIRQNDGIFIKKYRWISMWLGGVLYFLSFWLCQRYMFADIGVFLPVFLFLFLVIELFSKSENPFQNIAWNVLAVIYVVLPVMLLNKLYFDKGALFALAVLFIIWFFDSMCYISGSLVGRTKLFERISPKKTVEGFIGGFLLSGVLAWYCPVILAALCKEFGFIAAEYTSLQWLFIAVFTLVFATFGDLVESLLKRSIGIKDSGSILPGHGGFLDRFDALLLGIPFAAFAVWWVDQVKNILMLVEFLQH